MKRRLLITLIITNFYVISACKQETPEPEMIIETVSVEITTTPVPTPTPRSLTYMDIEPYILQTGDLPSDYSVGVISDTIPSIQFFNQARSLLEPYSATTLNIEAPYGIGDRVVILYYESNDDANKGFAALANPSDVGEDFEDLPDVGEKSVIGKDPKYYMGIPIQKLIFKRCNMVVYMSMNTISTSTLVNYAKRLDDRLLGEFCP